MNRFEDPIDFADVTSIGKVVIKYFNLSEFGQGSPNIGQISINGIRQKGRYGGPPLCDGRYVWVPKVERRLWGFRFRIAEIDATNGNLRLLGKAKTMIFLDRFTSDRIYFFEDLYKLIPNSYPREISKER